MGCQHLSKLTGGAAGPSSRRSAASTAVLCTSSAPQFTSCCVRRASSSALSSSAPLTAAGRAVPTARDVAGPLSAAGQAVLAALEVTERAGGCCAAAEAAGRADCRDAALAVVPLPASLPSGSAGTRLAVGAASAAVPGRLLGLAGRPGLAIVAADATVLPTPLLCCCARGSLRGDHLLPPPPPLPFRLLLLHSTCSAGCWCCC